MADTDDASWIRDVLKTLQSPHAEVVMDLLGHLNRLGKKGPEISFPPTREKEKLDIFRDEKEVLLRRRAAVYTRLKEGWQQVKNLPPCLKQAQLLKEAAFFSLTTCLLEDPFAENPVPLSPERARQYSDQALEIAEQLGDRVQAAEIYFVLTRLHTQATDYEKALACSDRFIELAEQAGHLHLLNYAWRGREELLTLAGATAQERIQCLRQLTDVAQKWGNVANILRQRGMLAKLLILEGELEEGTEELEKLRELTQWLPAKERGELIGQYYYGLCSLLSYLKGDICAAIESQKKAVTLNVESAGFREDFLWYGLAWLEMLCRRAGREEEFRALCRKLKAGNVPKLEQWYLEKDSVEPVAWDEELYFTGGLPESWRWIDPLTKGDCRIENSGLKLTPCMGGGFQSNVHAPRLMREVEGDFVIETVMDGDGGGAGGLLAYQDDDSLIRLGAGIQFDGEVSLTVKWLKRRISIVARGLLEAKDLHLRLERHGNSFRAWCGDGKEWYRCGEAGAKMTERIQVGLFTECTYRDHSVERCRADAVRFGMVGVIDDNYISRRRQLQPVL